MCNKTKRGIKYLSDILKEIYKEADIHTVKRYDISRCAICGRKEGDLFTLSPTKKSKRHIRFKVQISLHKLYANKYIPLCDGHHLEIHLFQNFRESPTDIEQEK